MLRMTYEIKGRSVNPQNIKDDLEQMVIGGIEDEIRSKLTGIRDPETGEFPVVAVRGRDLEHLSFEMSGSSRLVALVKKQLGLETGKVDSNEPGGGLMNGNRLPRAFLCHASEDKELARQIAHDFQAEGIETFFDEWEIGPGDSIRQKIDAGLGRCTHFVVLLTPNSVSKSWVNAEIDAAFVAKVEGRCRFIPLRYRLAVEELSPLLGALHSPELRDYHSDLSGLISFIHGVSRKPSVGPAPRAIRESSAGKLGLSPAAETIVQLMVERSEQGHKFDPQVGSDELRAATRLHDDDIVDAVDELEGRGLVGRHSALGQGPLGFVVLYAEAALFVEFDKYFKDWNPENDALRIAAGLINGDGGGLVSSIAEIYGWPARRMNPATNYLIERQLVDFSESLGIYPWCVAFIKKNAATRRFVRDRS
jgi:hypothetical protein